jgi:hypothetical protein
MTTKSSRKLSKRKWKRWEETIDNEILICPAERLASACPPLFIYAAACLPGRLIRMRQKKHLAEENQGRKDLVRCRVWNNNGKFPSFAEVG